MGDLNESIVENVSDAVREATADGIAEAQADAERDALLANAAATAGAALDVASAARSEAAEATETREDIRAWLSNEMAAHRTATEQGLAELRSQLASLSNPPATDTPEESAASSEDSGNVSVEVLTMPAPPESAPAAPARKSKRTRLRW